jgi:hypothetical protein
MLHGVGDHIETNIIQQITARGIYCNSFWDENLVINPTIRYENDSHQNGNPHHTTQRIPEPA